MINVTGSLQEKNKIYQAVLSFKKDDKWKTKWVSTKVKVKRGNRKKAIAELEKIKSNFSEQLNTNENNEIIPFMDFMKNWLNIIKSSVEETTFCGYDKIINGKLNTYFESKNITLQDLKARDIQDFYQYLLDQNLSGNTVQHYHANIRKALQYAVKTELIPSNPADKVQLPKIKQYHANYYSREELLNIFKIVKDTKIEAPVLLASFYGLRRSEIVGLKWSAIDFNKKTISINHIVTQTTNNHHDIIVEKDRTKTKSSTRTLPLLPTIESYLLDLRNKQNYNKIIYKENYNLTFWDYICVTETGELLYPNHITQSFRDLLLKNNLKAYRFHDLRHSVASLLLNEGVNMKQIQIWLGHSNYNTTANIYAHLDISSMNKSAAAISNVLTKSRIFNNNNNSNNTNNNNNSN